MYLRFFFLELYTGYSPFFFFFLLHGVSLIFERQRDRCEKMGKVSLGMIAKGEGRTRRCEFTRVRTESRLHLTCASIDAIDTPRGMA